MKAEPRFWPAVPDHVWDRIKTEFTLPTEDELRTHFEARLSDPVPYMQRAVRVFIGDGTYCPGFQLSDDGTFRQPVLDLFTRAMELKFPHNIFAAWMMTPLRQLGSSRPVDVLGRRSELMRLLEGFSRNPL